MQHVCMKNNADEVLCSYERLNFFRRGAFSPKKTTTVFLALKKVVVKLKHARKSHQKMNTSGPGRRFCNLPPKQLISMMS